MAVYSLTKSIQTAAWNSSTPKTHLDHNHTFLPTHIRTLIVQKKKEQEQSGNEPNIHPTKKR
jgi:hypothetical protein